ncbi:TonB-dependent receptor [Dechloromonas sp. A34]|uniref:TonB-dependent receptor n=1 Tax=Dechloromonas sp. A34 TaxID=447588 RepID=UPI0022494B6B|nr:TonB-dependent siderophore receptor [Dechloromonas sp. A34]
MCSKFKLKLSVLAVLASLGAGSAAAEEQTLTPINVVEKAERADGAVNGYRATRSASFTKTDTPLKEVPASVSVVPAELMKDQAMQSMADAIRYVPGALAHQGEGNRDQFILRGMSAGADMYVDGIRDDAQVFRDLYNLERVEVLKGAGGMIFGRGGAGGVINRVTKKPVFGHVGEASVTLGQYSQLRGTADVGGKLSDAAAWRLNVMGETADSFRDGADLQRFAINPTVTFLLAPTTTLTLGYEHLKDERTADRGFPSKNGKPYAADPKTFFGNPEQSNARSTVDGAYAILEHDLGGGMQLKNSFRVTHYDKFYQNVYPSTTKPVSATERVTINAYNNANERTNIFNQTDLITRFTTGPLEHTLLTGLELGHQDSTNKRNTGFFGAATSITVPVANPRAIATSFRPNGTDADNNVKADVAALYVQDQIAFSKEWKLLAGLRYDYFKAKLDDRRTLVTPVNLEHTDKEFSPRLGLIWSPTTGQSYYASYSYSFLPSAETLGLAANTANLDPENAKNYEIGGRWDLLPNLSLSTAVFRLDRNNVRNADGLGGIVLTGQTQTEGVELGLQGNVTRNWQVYAGYAHLDARITKATATAGNLNNRPQLVPENTLSVWNRVNVGHGLGAGLGVVYQGASYANADNRVQLPGFTRFDGALYYSFAGDKMRLALNVENLLDKEYFPTADANNNISPGAPRNARLTFTTSF